MFAKLQCEKKLFKNHPEAMDHIIQNSFNYQGNNLPKKLQIAF